MNQAATRTEGPGKIGQLAMEFCKKRLPVCVLQSHAGYYIGTFDDEGPCSRESNEYWRTSAAAEKALATGEWTQKLKL